MHERRYVFTFRLFYELLLIFEFHIDSDDFWQFPTVLHLHFFFLFCPIHIYALNMWYSISDTASNKFSLHSFNTRGCILNWRIQLTIFTDRRNMRRYRGNMTPLTLPVALHSGVIRYSLIALCAIRAMMKIGNESVKRKFFWYFLNIFDLI